MTMFTFYRPQYGGHPVEISSVIAPCFVVACFCLLKAALVLWATEGCMWMCSSTTRLVLWETAYPDVRWRVPAELLSGQDELVLGQGT